MPNSQASSSIPNRNIMEDVESALDDLEYFDPILSPLEEEKLCMDNICQCLNDCYFMIKQFTEGEESFNVVLVDQSLECFQLAISLIGADTSPERISEMGLKGNNNIPSFLSLIIRYISLDVSSIENEPTSNYSVHQIVKIFINLKIYSLKCFAKLISICSLETTEDSYKELSKNCAELFVKEEGLNALFQCLVISDKYDTNDKSDQKMRLIIVETLFFFVCRNDIARLAVVFQQGLLLLMELMTVEPNSTIRCYYCAILREFCITYPEDLVKENCIEKSIFFLSSDSCDDVRALSADIIEMLIKNDPSNLERIDMVDLSKLLNSVLNNDTPTVVESCCKLCEALFKNDRNKTIHTEFIKNSYWVSLVRVMRNHDLKTCACAVKSMRYLAQFSDRDDMAQKCFQKYDAISTIIKYLLDTTLDNKPKTEEKIKNKFRRDRTPHKHQQHQQQQLLVHDEAVERLRTSIKLESAIFFSLLFYRSSKLNQKVKDELKVFPNWISALRRKLLPTVVQTNIEYFKDVFVTNELGWNMANYVSLEETEYEDKTVVEYIILEQHPPTVEEESIDNDGRIIQFLIKHSLMQTFEQPVLETQGAESESPRPIETQSPIHRRVDSLIRKSKIAETPSPQTSKPKTPALSSNAVPSPISFISEKTPEDLEQKPKKEKEWIAPISILSPQDGEEFTPGYFSQPTDNLLKGDKVEKRTEKVSRNLFSSPVKSIPTYEDVDFHRLISICKAFSMWYESTEMRYSREEEQDRFITTFQLAKLGKQSPMYSPLNSPKDPRASKGTHLYYQKIPYHFKHSPQKLTKVWNDEHVKLSDVFQFHLLFDQIDEKNLLSIIDRLKKHLKVISRDFIVTPKEHNARGRKVFLLDLKQNILPKLEQTFLDILKTGQDVGFSRIIQFINSWKETKVRTDLALTHENLLEVMECIKIEMAKEHFEKSKMDKSELK